MYDANIHYAQKRAHAYAYDLRGQVIVRKEIKTHRNVLGEELRPAAMTQEV
jgi:hypothetical protein